MQVSFNASITLEMDDDEFDRTVAEYQETNDDLTREQAVDEFLFDLAETFEGQEVYSVEGDAWLVFVEQGGII